MAGAVTVESCYPFVEPLNHLENAVPHDMGQFHSFSESHAACDAV
jgi:hypothetical protein